MISWLKGRVLDIDENEVTIDTGNIGYRVHIGENRLLQMGIEKESEAEMVIYTIVREDEIRLFGFDSFFSRKIFDILLSVNGVGPKAAISILDCLEPQQIVMSIQNGDHTPFLTISGIGKKTAQRIILDLQGKMEKLEMPGNQDSPGTVSSVHQKNQANHIGLVADAKSALSNLGFTDKDADRVVRKHLKPGLGLNEIIRKSLADLQQ